MIALFKSKRNSQGWTLVELMITIVITAILVILAIPSFTSFINTQRLVGTTENLYATLQSARWAAIKNNATVVVSFQTGSSWCYGVNTLTACNCTTPSNCNLGAVTAPNTDLSLSLTGVSGTPPQIQIESTHGAPNASGQMTFTISNTSTAMSVMINVLGSLLACSSQVNGYQVCP